MKIIVPISLLLLLSTCKPATSIPEIEQYSIEQFYKNINISGGNFSADESKLLVNSNESGIYNAYEIDLNTGESKTLTDSQDESYFGVSYFPEDDRFIYLFDEGGNEQFKIYLMNNGVSKSLTPEDTVRNIFWGWSRDQQSMFYSSNKRDAKFMDIYELEISAMEDEIPIGALIYENNDGLDVRNISPNKRYFALIKNITNADDKMYLYDRETGDTKDISVHEGDVQYNPQFFSLDNQYLYYMTNKDQEFTYLARIHLDSGEIETVYSDSWDVWYGYHSWNEKYRVIGINEDAKTKVRIFEVDSGNEIMLPDIEGGSISSVNISKSEKLARLTVSTSTTPSNMYLYNFESGELKKLTNTLNPEIDHNHLVEGKVVRYKSFDGVEIPAIYYQPQTASADHPVPGLVWVHGGPGGQSRLSYFALIQFLVNQGYAILAVNNRGSSGYGKTFHHMDDLNHGDEDLKDCVAGKDFLISTGVVDSERIGIIGGSYGGYMVMAALTFEPEVFDVGVNIFGVTNWIRTLRSIPPHWESFKEALYKELGDPNTEDSVRLYQISPLFHAEKVTKPLMVLQGANDIRVLQVESDEIVENVKANNVPVEYIIFEDEGHGFRKKENEIEGYGKIGVFLDQYLKATPAEGA